VPATDGDLADDEGGATAGRREDVRVAFVQPLDRDPWQRREDGGTSSVSGMVMPRTTSAATGSLWSPARSATRT
jgi:hypothetical protein